MIVELVARILRKRVGQLQRLKADVARGVRVHAYVVLLHFRVFAAVHLERGRRSARAVGEPAADVLAVRALGIPCAGAADLLGVRGRA